MMELRIKLYSAKDVELATKLFPQIADHMRVEEERAKAEMAAYIKAHPPVAPLPAAPITAAQAAEMNPPSTPLEIAINEAKEIAAEPNVQPAKEKKGRGRQPKVKTDAAPLANGNTIENAGGDPDFPIITAKVTEQPAKVLTAQDVRDAFKAVQGKHGMPEVISMLKGFGVERISDLAEAKYGEAIAACNAKVA